MAASTSIHLDWSVTPEKVDEALRRIVEAADPLQIVLFGSRARGDHRPDSDVDLAVILDGPQEGVRKRVPYAILHDLQMDATVISVSKAKYDLFRPWINSVYNYIETEGIVLYDREHPESARPDALRQGAAGRAFSDVSTAR